MGSKLILPGTEATNPYKGCNKPWDWRPGDDIEEFYDKGWEAARFIERFCRHTKGRWKGRPFVLHPFQLSLILTVFGTVDEDLVRLIRTVYVEWARKNGKSEIAAAIALKLLFADGEQSGEIYGAAVDKDQATIVFNVAAEMVRLAPESLQKKARIIDSQKRIVAPTTGSFYVAIPADAAGAHGFNASGVIVDEVHKQKNRDLYDALDTSGGTRDQPLIFGITTAGSDRTSLCWELHKYSEDVREQRVPEDPTWHSDLRNTPEEADWKDPKVWFIANPGLGTKEEIAAGKAFRSIDELQRKVKQAEARPAMETTIRNLYLNQWTSTRSKWLDMSSWVNKCGAPFDVTELLEKPCYGGLDLSSTTDVTAWALLFPWEVDEVTYVRALWRFWLPESRVENDPGSPLAQWAREGLITATDGDVIDYDRIEREIGIDAELYDIREIGFDPWQATQLVQHLADGGLTMAKVGQTMPVLTDPTKELERLIALGHFLHNGNPVAHWMASNAVVKRSGDLMKPDKEKSAQVIDGIAAAVNALERLMHAEAPVGTLIY